MTFSSVYEMFDPLTTVRKQRFWDWFSGNNVKSIWNETDVAGGGAVVSIFDGVDDGVSILTPATSGDQGEIDFNNKRQYAHDGSVFISVFKANSTTTLVAKGGFSAGITDDAANSAWATTDSGNTYFACRTKDGSTASNTESTTTRDTSFHVHSFTLNGSNCTYKIDGIDSTVKTTNLPTTKMQPVLNIETLDNAARRLSARYIEAYNT